MDWQFYGKDDIIKAMRHLGHSVDISTLEPSDFRTDPNFTTAFNKILYDGQYQAVFTSNYYPIISDSCQHYNIKYISWGYDSPWVLLYSNTIYNSCNYVFWFDKAQCEDIWKHNVSTVYYLPLAVDMERLNAIQMSKQEKELFGADVSMVASLYNEKHNLYDRMEPRLDDYTRGYLEAAMLAQKNLFGGFILEELLHNSTILANMKKALRYDPDENGFETSEYIYANYFLSRKVASMQRLEYIDAISRNFEMKVYTPGDLSMIPTAKKMGTVDYLTDMTKVFRASKINFNITLPSIHTGMPLRVIDIMGAGGFLLTNYQADFFDFFEPDKDFVYYTSLDDALDKIGYYLNHEEERAQIANNAKQRMAEAHTILQRMETIFEICAN